MKIRWKILYAYLALTFATLIALLAPSFWAILSLFTLGLLSLIPNIWIYSTLLLPVFLLRKNTGWPMFYKVASTGLTVVVALGVPILLNAAIDSTVAGLTKGDFNKSPSFKPQHLMFVVNRRSYSSNSSDPLSNSECDRLCQRLLLNRAVETVTVQALDRGKEISLAQYRFEKRDHCPDAFAGFDVVIIDTVLNAIDGNCVIPIIDENMGDGFVIEQVAVHPDDWILTLGGLPAEATQILISEKKDERYNPIVQLTSLEYTKSNKVFFLNHYFGLLTTVSGWQISGRKVAKNGFTLAEFLDSEYQIPALPPKSTGTRKATDSTAGNLIHLDATVVSRLLNDGISTPFNRGVTEALTGWVADMAYRKSGPPTVDETALVKKMISDPRVKDLQSVAWALIVLPQLTRDASQEIISRICLPDSTLHRVTVQRLLTALKKHTTLLDSGNITDGPDGVSQFRAVYCT